MTDKTNQKEFEPNGMDQHSPGAKMDHGKTMVALVMGDFSNALEAISEVGTFGAEKYSPHGWLTVGNGFERYEDAKLRHFLKRHQGEFTDPDSNLLHLAHEAWNAVAVLELFLRENHGKRNNIF